MTSVTAHEQFHLRFETVDGLTVAYRACGEGPALVLLAGFGQSSAWWLHFVDNYAESYSVVAPDLKGFGYSSKPSSGYSITEQATLMAHLMSQLGLNRISLLGLSLGGVVAARIAGLFPSLIDKLVLVSTPFLRGSRMNKLNMKTVPIALRLLRDPVLARLVVSLRSRPFMRLVFNEMAYPAHRIELPPRAVQGILQDAYTNTWQSLHGSAKALVMENMEDEVRNIAVPALVVHGEMDRMMPLCHARGLQEGIRNSRLVVVKGAGHGVMLHRGEEFIKIVCDFLNGVSPG